VQKFASITLGILRNGNLSRSKNNGGGKFHSHKGSISRKIANEVANAFTASLLMSSFSTASHESLEIRVNESELKLVQRAANSASQ